MNAPHPRSAFSLIVVRVGESSPTVYSIEEAAGIAHVHPERVRHYCRLGLFGAALAQAGLEPVFDDDALYELRRFEHFRQRHRVGLKTLRLLCALWRELEDVKAELRHLRRR